MQPEPQTEEQPLLPRIKMVWFFVIVTLLAVALGIVRATEQWRALVETLVVITVFALVFCVLSGSCFFVAYLFGAMERAFAGGDAEKPSNPFIDGTPPAQILPPRATHAD